MGFLDRVKSLLRAEGSNRGPFSGMGELGGVYGIPSIGDGWQRNLRVDHNSNRVPAVYACVMAIARSVSQCYPKHIRNIDGKFEDIRTSAAYRVLMNPNGYQTAPDFLLNLVATALFEGEAFVIASRNARQEIDAMHLLPIRTCSPLIDADTREVFYSVGPSPLAPGGVDYIAPARDVMHLRFHTPRHPLIGESPIKSAALAIGINVALSHSQAAFFNNMNRPSGIMSTEASLTRDQMQQLRAAFEDQAAGMSQGRIPILGGGLKFSPIAISSQDAELVQAQRMSIEDICRVFGVPPPLVGDLSHATLNNSETLISNFLAMSLGSYLEHIERAFDRLFGLSGNDYVELDVAALLRTDFAGRIDGLTKAVQGGLFTPNEARNREGVGPIPGGDTAYLQKQMIPIDKIGELLEAETEKLKAPAPAPTPNNDAPVPVDPPPAEKDLDPEIVRAMYSHRRTLKKAAA